MTRELTPTMRSCLTAVKAHPGTPAGELPGGLRTVLALMRRELVEFDRAPADVDAERVPIFAPAHKHQFKSTMHLDGCHWYQSAGGCSCGATIGIYGERSLATDPWSAVWMDEGGGDEPCERCDQLRAGARVRYHVEITGPRRRPERTPGAAAA